MSERPPVPNWIRKFSYPGWTNVFQLVPKNESLYGTETLFGDWDARILLLAKDGAPTPVIRALRDKGEPRPWRHAQREMGDRGGLRGEKKIRAFPLYHPAARVSTDLMESGWRGFAKKVSSPTRQVKVVKPSVN
jgi:hypothetical protein